MAFKIPTLSEVNRIVENGFSEAFYGTSGVLRAMVLKVVAKVFSGSVYLVVLLVSAVWKNIFISTAGIDGLVRKGDVYGMPPKPASRARGNVIVEGNENSSVPAGTVLLDPVTLNEYATLSDAVLSSGVTTTSVQVYSIGFGSEFNLSAGTRLEFRDSSLGEFSFVVDSEGLFGGSSVDVTIDGAIQKWGESVEDYRSRLKVRAQNQPMGGSDSDYWQWAMSIKEVSDCFVYPNWPFTNCVSVFCADFRSDSISLNSSILSMVENYITSNDRRPITSKPIIGTVSPVTISFVCYIPVVNDFYKNTVASSLKSFFRTLGPGQKFDAEVIRKRIIDFGGVSNCNVNGLKVNGSPVSGFYVLGKNYSQNGDDIVISGEVVNTSNIDASIEFEMMV